MHLRWILRYKRPYASHPENSNQCLAHHLVQLTSDNKTERARQSLSLMTNHIAGKLYQLSDDLAQLLLLAVKAGNIFNIHNLLSIMKRDLLCVIERIDYQWSKRLAFSGQKN